MASSYEFLMIIFTLVFISTLQAAAIAATSSSQTYKTYIEKACNSTTYPELCNSSLSPYASKIKGNPQKLCKAALSIAIKATHNASSTISKLLKQKGLTSFETSILEDCVTNTKDSIDELKQSLNATRHLNGSDKESQVENMKTWVSAALTDDDTCTDGFDDGQGQVSETLKNRINDIILKIARLTSNALSLINTLKF
ncbi:pectinesterase inhibitor 4-like [Corylus avellana]|uniref:pectinesterase inhibitor 4-like n=1 Tax=Corylus avellana TaxID=13451 RepID=UPI001E23309B|nr:pectinesterase inhibitor 4-like [Corylus avellana]